MTEQQSWRLDGPETAINPYSPVCARCRHLTNGLERRCLAFSNGIPLVIWTGATGHRAPYPGDRGIRFELVHVSPNAIGVRHD